MSSPVGSLVAIRWKRDNTKQSGVIGSAAPFFQLLPHSTDWGRVTAAGASRRAALHRAIELWLGHLFVSAILALPTTAILDNNLKIYSLGPWTRQEFRATERLDFLANQRERINGTSAPHPGPSHRIVRAQR